MATDALRGFDLNVLYCLPCCTSSVLCERHLSSGVDVAIEVTRSAFGGRGSSLQRRHEHSCGVRERAVSLCGGAVSPVMHFRESLALVHDIGYAFPDSGMHALDGARYLRDECPGLAYLAPYVAWHSTAVHEYRARGSMRFWWLRSSLCRQERMMQKNAVCSG